MEITACPICGSKNIGIGTLGDGIISGLSSWKEVCRNCGYQGASLVFESEVDYNKFLAALSYQRKQQEPQVSGPDDENKQRGDEQTKGLNVRSESAENHDNISACVEKKNYSFEFILAVVLSIVFFVLLYGSRFLEASGGLFSQNDLFTMLLFVFGSFVAVVVFFFLFIVFVEMIYRSIRRKKT